MKKLIFITSSLLLVMLIACNNASVSNQPAQDKRDMQTFNLDTSNLKRGQIFYQCSMDPQVISDKPGSCPVCGMDLSEIKKQ